MSKYVRQDVANVIGVAFSTSASVPAGGGVLISSCLFGVAESDIAATTVAVENQLRVRGVVQINKTASVQFNIGDQLFWDDSGKVVVKTGTTQKEVGIAVSSTSNGAGETTCLMMIVPTIRNATNS